MLKFAFPDGKDKALKILCTGAHGDDIEIGCGGSILRLLKEHDDVEVHWVVLGSGGRRGRESIASANRFLKNAKKKNIVINDFKDGFFPYTGGKIKTYFEKEIKKISPDMIFTHHRDDLHQDHRLVSELTWNTFRDHLILEYEIVKYDGDIGAPNVFVHLDDETCRQKIRIIMDSFESQRGKNWFTEDAFLSILRIRGIESRAARYAEGFTCRKLVL